MGTASSKVEAGKHQSSPSRPHAVSSYLRMKALLRWAMVLLLLTRATQQEDTRCLDDSTCTAPCEACCVDYLLDQASCDACVEEECPSKINICSGNSTCNVCDACCVGYLLDQASCDACAEEQC